MSQVDRCDICGEEATHDFMGHQVCENVACQQVVLDIINGEAREAVYNSWEEGEAD